MNSLWPMIVAEKTGIPDDKDVVAGWLGAAVLLALIVAVALLCWNFTHQIRKAKAAKDAGVYGDKPVDNSSEDDAQG
ncbi:hypothetical protein ncot_15160 [Nocardioides sp. JQ2195]|uniref:hypothetical protein n=1 Tax=Nocardioides sp. JQ2195 TaxID=2592334 RepID=UPI00143EEDAF|nr:hypothetical protein [Nocardioides sp. JQ2195]QIX27782.1 hypothetical protein ncot_15160 [Nocardioides sp. JQ2195]